MTVEEVRLFAQFGVRRLSPQNQAILTEKWNQIRPTCTHEEYKAWLLENEGKIDISILFRKIPNKEKEKVSTKGIIYA